MFSGLFCSILEDLGVFGGVEWAYWPVSSGNGSISCVCGVFGVISTIWGCFGVDFDDFGVKFGGFPGFGGGRGGWGGSEKGGGQCPSGFAKTYLSDFFSARD